PAAITSAPSGTLYVSDFGNNRVLTFTPGGGYTQPLSSYYQLFVDSCISSHPIDYQAVEDPDVVYPGFTGNVWTKFSELAQANGHEIAVINGTITIRDIMEREISDDLFNGPPSLGVNAQ